MTYFPLNTTTNKFLVVKWCAMSSPFILNMDGASESNPGLQFVDVSLGTRMVTSKEPLWIFLGDSYTNTYLELKTVL